MPGSYSPILGARWGNNADCQGFASNRFVPQDCGSGTLATAWSATPIDGALGYRSTVGDKHLKFYDAVLAADVLVPRLNYNESVTGQWAFGYNPGGASSFTVASTTVVTNLNADLLDGYNTSQTATASTVAVRDSNARLLAGDPSGTVNGEVVTYGFLYSFVAGVRDPKQAALALYYGATTDLNADHPYTWSGGAQTITINANGAFAFDGITVAVNDRVALIGETGANQKYNGLYIVTQIGTAGVPLVLQRTADADTDAEVTNGLQFWVTTGTTYGSSGWLLTTADPITLNTTALVFVQNNGTAGITAGNGIVKVGNTIHAVQSAAYTTGGIVYANATTTLTLFTTAGVVQATSGGAPTTATGTQYGVPYWATTTTLGTSAAPGSATVVLHGAVAGAPTWSAVSLTADVSGTLPVANGGTGAVTLTGMLKGNGTSAITAVTGAANRVTFWSDANTLSSTSAFTWDSVNLGLTAGILFVGTQTISTTTGILTVTGTSGLTLTSGTSNTLITQNSVNVFTSEGSGAIVNTLYLKAGNVGIGTAAPSKLLTLEQSNSGTSLGDGVVLRINGQAGVVNTRSEIGFSYFGSGTNIPDTIIGSRVVSSSGNDKSAFYIATRDVTTNTTPTERFTVDTTGNVGIATTAPSTLLHLGLAGTTLGTLGFAGNTSGLITMNSAAVAGTWTFTLPTSGGTANYALITNGSGVSSWSILPVAGGGTGRTVFVYATQITGDDVTTTFTITHGLGTRDVHVTVYDITTGSPDYQEIEFLVIKHATTTTVTVAFGAAVPTGTNYRVVVS